jgi:very-short-patch-repair endonuclease
MKSKMPYYHEATKQIFDNAKKLRRNQTPAEERLWKILRSHKIKGLKFRRQHPIYRFIADFYCHDLKLIIEIDGSIHLLDDIKEYDIKREEKLKQLGLNVIRFTNEQVFMEPEIIVDAIMKLCK